MASALLIALALALALAFAAAWQRRADLRLQRDAVVERAAQAVRGAGAGPLQVPVIDLQKCLGCGTCVRECPEDGVLALVHGQAAVVNAAACVGHARCVAECPAGAVTLSQGDLSQRRDVPALDAALEVPGQPGLFLVGEITARSLIRTATTQGAAAVATIAARLAGQPRGSDDQVFDVVVVGAGPGGFAAALACQQHGLRFLLLDQEATIGGTVARYPRRKLVLTDDIELPLGGRLPQREYLKEELIELWTELAVRHRLPFRGGVTFDRIERLDDGLLAVLTDKGRLRARCVVLAVGRRGSPRRLGVPGEDQPHVVYSLVDAVAYKGRRCVVVGGGDSAIETALALAEQPGNHVTVVYRQDAFFRLRSRNRQRLEQVLAAGRIEALLGAEVRAIGRDHVEVVHGQDGGGVALQLAADHVFIMAGGVPPFAQLERSGVSFDPADRPEPPPAAPATAAGDELWLSLGAGLALALVAIGFVLWHHDYYLQPAAVRAADPKHALLRPDRSLGLWFGIAAVAAVLANLAYLLRRQQLWGVRFGRLSGWMTAHVATGVVAVLLAMLHAALSPRSTPGGYAFWGLVALLVTGSIGRWFYAWLPRQANGRELELDALRRELGAAAPPAAGAFAAAVRAETLALVERRQWRSTWLGRVVTLVGLQWDLWRTLRRIRRHGASSGVSGAEIAAAIERARSAHGLAIAVAHLEDLRALLGTWRWLHRWLALLLVLLLIVHVVVAVLHGAFAGGGRL